MDMYQFSPNPLVHTPMWIKGNPNQCSCEGSEGRGNRFESKNRLWVRSVWKSIRCLPLWQSRKYPQGGEYSENTVGWYMVIKYLLLSWMIMRKINHVRYFWFKKKNIDSRDELLWILIWIPTSVSCVTLVRLYKPPELLFSYL